MLHHPLSAVNIAVLTVRGVTFTGLLIESAVSGFGGAFILLALSKGIAGVWRGIRVIGSPQCAMVHWLSEGVPGSHSAADYFRAWRSRSRVRSRLLR